MPSSNHHPNSSNACHPQTRHQCDQMRWGLGPTRWSWETEAQNNNLEDVCISAGGERFHFQGTDCWCGGLSLDMQRMTLHQQVIKRRCAKWKQGLLNRGSSAAACRRRKWRQAAAIKSGTFSGYSAWLWTSCSHLTG
jgi:hypothetical protein